MDLVAIIAANAFTNALDTIFGPLVDLMRQTLIWLDGLLGSWGLAIIGLTVIVRLALMPVTIPQYRSQLAMQALQPKVKALQQKFKKDRARVQQETMKLYGEYGVHPLGSCWTLIIQMPIMLCLYYTIKGTDELQNASFLWIPALGEPDPYYLLFILYIASQLVTTELMLAGQSDPQQKWLMRGMPLVFGVILYRFPSALMLYWVTTNIWMIGQQLIIKRSMPKGDELLAIMAAKPKKESRFMKAMADAQAEQKAKQERQEARKRELLGGDDAAGDGDAAKPSASGKGKQGPAGKGQGQRSGKSGASRRGGAKSGGGKPPAGRSKKSGGSR